MRKSLSVYIGLRYTGAKRRNQLASFLTVISVLGLTVGVALLIAVLSIMNGFDRELREKILGLVPQAAIYHREGISDWQALAERVEQNADVVASSPFIQVSGLINFRKHTETVMIFGIEPEAERRVSIIDRYLEGPMMEKLESGEAYVVLGKAIAERLGVKEGDKVLVIAPKGKGNRSSSLSYSIVAGLLESKTELDSQLILTSLTHARELAGIDGVSGLRLKLTELFDAPAVVRQAVDSLGYGYYGSSWVRTHGNLYQAIQMSKSMVGLLMLLLVAIAAFNVVSTLVMVVIDKESDIAILRTMGASSAEIVKIFMVLGTTIGLIGTTLGIVCGIVLALGAESFVQWIESLFGVQFLRSDVYPLTYLPADILPSDIIQVSLTALFMCFLATLYPAWRASRVKPAEALRYE